MGLGVKGLLLHRDSVYRVYILERLGKGEWTRQGKNITF